jgi:hypothetical protein
MYRIELAPGEETVFRTIEELAVAVRNGLVTPRCRIYHNATQKWLPIEFHPHYKKALSLPAARVAEAGAPRTSGHPPALETLSFAVAPAARPTPVAEPVVEPTPELAVETRAGNPAAQARQQAERSGQERSVTKRPGGDRVGYQGGAEHRSAERSDAKQSGTGSSAKNGHAGTARPGAESSATAHSSKEHSAAAHSPKEHSGSAHSPKEHSGAEHSGAGHPGTDHLDARYSGAELPVTTHPVTKHGVTDHPADLSRHPARAHALARHSAVAHPAADETAARAATEHPAVAHPAAEHSPIEHPVAESPYPAPRAAERPAVEHRFTSHTDTAAESPIRAEPAPTPKSKSSSYRPDSYLPPSVRVIADDPHVAIAPEPAVAPPVPAPPRRSWSMMPAVQETPELPTISYPEITPAVEPVAERPSSSRGHRPLQVAVAVLVLAAGGYLARSFYSPVPGSHEGGDASAPAATVADRPALPKDTSAPAPTAVTTKPSRSRPAVITPTAPASSGFAAALEPRAIAPGPAPILPARPAAAQLPPAVSAADSAAVAASIAPPPAEMQIDVPALPGGDSLVVQPRSKSDSAMKRILRAVNGGQNPK